MNTKQIMLVSIDMTKAQIERLQAMADVKTLDPRLNEMAAAVAKDKVRELLK